MNIHLLQVDDDVALQSIMSIHCINSKNKAT